MISLVSCEMLYTVKMNRTCYEFYSDTCAPCKRVALIVWNLVRHYGIHLVKINVELEPGVAHEHGVRGIPTLILMENKREIRRISGAVSENKLRQFFND